MFSSSSSHVVPLLSKRTEALNKGQLKGQLEQQPCIFCPKMQEPDCDAHMFCNLCACFTESLKEPLENPMIDLGNGDFARLRAALERYPSQVAFAFIVDELGHLSDDATKELSLDYAQEHLAHWPDETRTTVHKQTWPDFPRTLAPFWFPLVRRFLFLQDDFPKGLPLETLAQRRGSFLWLERLTQLTCIGNKLGPADLHTLASSPYAAGLEVLNLTCNMVQDQGAIEIANSHHLGHLQKLYLKQNLLTPEGAKSILYSSRLPKLKTLCLSELKAPYHGVQLFCSPLMGQLSCFHYGKNRLTPSDAESIASCPQIGALCELHLNDCALGEDGAAGAAAIVMSPHLDSLQQLDLGGNGIDDQGAGVLANASQLLRLTSLDLRANPLSDQGLSIFARTARFASLKRLNLRRTWVGDEGVRALASSSNLPELKMLDLGWSSGEMGRSVQLGRSGLHALLASSTLSNLDGLSIIVNREGDEFDALLSSPHLRRLKRLDVYGLLTAEPIEALVTHPLVDQLEELHLRLLLGEDGDRVIEAIASSNALPSLKSLCLWSSSVSEESIARMTYSPVFGRLSQLRLLGTGLTTQMREALALSPQLRNCNMTTLDDCQQCSDGTGRLGW